MNRLHQQFIFILSVLFLLSGCSGNKSSDYSEFLLHPVLTSSHTIKADGDTLQPIRLQLHSDTLFVAYNGRAQIDLFTHELKKIKSIFLNAPEPIYPASFAVTDSELIVCDHSKRAIVLFDRSGGFLESYGTLPDAKTSLAPLALTYYGGVLYVTDIHLRKILAISMADAPGITERGELILTIPDDASGIIGFPSVLLVTPDGRLLVGDAGHGSILAFTCDGRFIYPFDSVAMPKPLAVQGFAIDDVVDPGMQDSSSFDPSGVRSLGRIHVVDANNGRIHLFNPVGEYVTSYPESPLMDRPSDIAIDIKRKLIYVADPASAQILIYSYRG